MKRSLIFLLFGAIVFCTSAQNKIDPKSISPSCFIINNGQWPDEVAFLARSTGLNAWILHDGGVMYDFFSLSDTSEMHDLFHDQNRNLKRSQPIYRRNGHVIRMDLLNGNFDSLIHVKKNNIKNYYFNFIIGRDQKKWASFVSAYNEVIFENLYNGIDVRYYFENSMLRYDFIIHPGANVSDIKMNFCGQTNLSINNKGELVFNTSIGNILHQKLLASQKENAQVNCSFRQSGSGEIRFNVGTYDHAKDLIIDPLIYATFLGGVWSDFINGIVTDKFYNLYVTGSSNSLDFPNTTGPYNYLIDTMQHVFVSKFNSSGTNLIFSTIVGDTTGAEFGNWIVLDPSNNIYVCGVTTSIGFPVTPTAFDTSINGDLDIFVFKLNQSGSLLLSSTFLGGSGYDFANSILRDSQGNIYISGRTVSTNYPTTSGCFDATFNGQYDVVLTKLNPSLTSLVYSTYIGGSAVDVVHAGTSMYLDKDNNMVMTGSTNSVNFPTTVGTYDNTQNGKSDAFVLKMNNSGSAFVFSTFLGYTEDDFGYGVCLSGNDILIAGYTFGAGFPSCHKSYDTTFNGGNDIFIAKFNQFGSSLIKSTYLGAFSMEIVTSIMIDTSGNIIVTGYTSSADFPITIDAFDYSMNGDEDVFLTVINSDLTKLKYSTFIGGKKSDQSNALCRDDSGYIYIAGITKSENFPVTPNAFDTTLDVVFPAFDGFIVKFWVCDVKEYSVIGGGYYCVGQPGLSITVSGSQTGVNYYLYRDGKPLGITVNGTGFPFTFGNITTTGAYSVIAIDTLRKCTKDMLGNAMIVAIPELFNVSGGGVHCLGDIGLNCLLSGSDTNVVYELYLDSIPTGRKIQGTSDTIRWNHLSQSGYYEVYARTKNGCNSKMNGFAYVSLYESPVAKFSISDTVLCLNKNKVTLINQSGIKTGSLTYKWDFGDGQTSTATDTVYIYKFCDTFLVSLSAISDNNCIDTFTRNLIVYASPKAFYTVSDTISCKSGTYFNFYDKSSVPYGSYSRLWSFGDNDTSTQQNPSHGYGSYDSFKAKITITSSFGCKDSFSRFIYVIPIPKASYALTDTVQCLGINAFNFQNTSKTSFGSLSFLWNFGDGSTSADKHPVYSYLSAGTYKVTLIATAGSSCLDSFIGLVYVSLGPVAAIAVNDTSQCFVNNYFVFIDKSSIVNGNITSIAWNLGDGTTSTSANPTHSFNTDDSFNVQLTVNADIGCNDSTILKVFVRPMPVAGFTMNTNPQNLLMNNFVFTNASSLKYGVLTATWDFGDGNTSLLLNPVHTYTYSDTFSVNLVATSEYGCADTFTDLAYITTLFVVASFTSGIACAGDIVRFFNTSTVIAPDSLKNTVWDFGDTTGTIVMNNADHIFRYPGSYRVIMEVFTKNANKDRDTQRISVLPKPTVSIACSPDTISLIGELITLSVKGNYDALLWDNGLTTPTITIDKSGKYWVTASYIAGCTNSDTILLRFIDKPNLQVVNVITPNGDGINDYFKILNIDLFQPCKLTIYNRWGDELYSATDYKNDWKGRYKGKTLAEGAYYYVIHDKNGIVYKGAINILK